MYFLLSSLSLFSRNLFTSPFHCWNIFPSAMSNLLNDTFRNDSHRQMVFYVFFSFIFFCLHKCQLPNSNCVCVPCPACHLSSSWISFLKNWIKRHKSLCLAFALEWREEKFKRTGTGWNGEWILSCNSITRQYYWWMATMCVTCKEKSEKVTEWIKYSWRSQRWLRWRRWWRWFNSEQLPFQLVRIK